MYLTADYCLLTGTDYVGNIEYSFSNDGGDYQFDLDKIYNPEGYSQGLTTPVYYYYRKDHLGNNREVWNANTNTPVQRAQYYPSGLPWAATAADNPSMQPYKYNGKEFVEMNGLDEYDSQARMYYPAVMRTTTPDPLMEKHYDISPYAWCGNNPVNRIDLDGMDWIRNNDTGNVQWRPDATKSNVHEGYEYIGTEYMGITITKFETTKNEYTNGQKDTKLEIEIGYKDPNSKKKNAYNWIQTVSRDGKNPKVDYDSKTEEGQANFPYYQPEDENKDSKNKDGFDITFHDRPNEPNKKGSFNAELSLIGETNTYKNVSMVPQINIPIMTGKTLTTIFTLNYGFSGSNIMMRILPINVITPSNFQSQTINQIK